MDSATATFKDEAFLSDTLLLSQELLIEILDLLQVMQAISPERKTIWNLQLTRLTLDISRFVEITTLLSKVAFSKHRELMSLVKNSHIHLLFVLKAINQAQHKQDLVALEDLIKYELKDNLTQWKIDLIPQTKRHLNA